MNDASPQITDWELCGHFLYAVQVHLKVDYTDTESMSHTVRDVGILHINSDVPTNIYFIISTWDIEKKTESWHLGLERSQCWDTWLRPAANHGAARDVIHFTKII